VTKAEYERLKAQLRNRYESDLEALDRVWSWSNHNAHRASKPSLPKHLPPAPNDGQEDQPKSEFALTTDERASRQKRERGSVEKNVREVVAHHLNGTQFGSPDVVVKAKEHLNVDVNRTSVSAALERLVTVGLLEVVERGIGRKPTAYRKVINN
jgi:hypothetical protein